RQSARNQHPAACAGAITVTRGYILLVAATGAVRDHVLFMPAPASAPPLPSITPGLSCSSRIDLEITCAEAVVAWDGFWPRDHDRDGRSEQLEGAGLDQAQGVELSVFCPAKWMICRSTVDRCPGRSLYQVGLAPTLRQRRDETQ